MERFNKWYADPSLTNDQLQTLLEKTLEQHQDANDQAHMLYLSIAGIRNVIQTRMHEGIWYEAD